MQHMIDNNEYKTFSASESSLFEALGQLPRQYFKIITRPSIKTISAEVGWARWSTVIVQLFLLVAITAGLNVLGEYVSSAALHTIAAFSLGSLHFFGWLPAPFNGIVFILATFFIGLGTAYPFSRLSKGRGRFVEHIFILLLVTIPLVTISGLLLLIPAAGLTVTALVAVVSVLFIYRMVLHVQTIRAVHHLPALSAVLIVLIIPILLLIVGIIVTLGKLFDGLDLDLPDFSIDFPERKKKPANRLPGNNGI